MNDVDKPLKLLHISGPGRSGSTLIEKIIGEIHGVAALGEVVYVWDRGFKKGQKCGCGKPFDECEVWEAIKLNAFGEGTSFDLDRLLSVTLEVERFRHVPFHLLKSSFPGFQAKLDYLGENLLRLYRGAALAHGASVLIDSSKHIHGHVLASMPEIELYVLHLVRDARATAHSWNRAKVYETRKGKSVYMPRVGPATATLYWVIDNISAELLRFRGNHYMRMRYEDFVSEPRSLLERIVAFVGIEASHIPISEDAQVDFGVQHSVSGNPVRFKQGVTSIKPDHEWKTAMPPLRRKLVTILAWPLLLRYGYLSSTQSR